MDTEIELLLQKAGLPIDIIKHEITYHVITKYKEEHQQKFKRVLHQIRKTRCKKINREGRRLYFDKYEDGKTIKRVKTEPISLYKYYGYCGTFDNKFYFNRLLKLFQAKYQNELNVELKNTDYDSSNGFKYYYQIVYASNLNNKKQSRLLDEIFWFRLPNRRIIFMQDIWKNIK